MSKKEKKSQVVKSSYFKGMFSFPMSYELTFVIIAFIYGMWFVYLNPPFHSNDEDRHFLKAYHITQEGLVPELSPDSTKVGSEIPANIPAVVMSFQGVPYHMGQKLNKKRVEDLAKVPQLSNNRKFEHNFQWNNFPIPYLPASFAIIVADSEDTTPVELGYAGRIGMLLFYMLFMFFIIKTAPVWKSIFFLYGLTPMVLYQSASVTYDVMSTSLTFLIMALALYYIFDKNAKFGIKDLIWVLVLVYFQITVKNGYFILAFIFLLIPNSKFDKSLNPWLFKAIILSALILFINYGLSIWNFAVSDIKEGYLKTHEFQKDFKLDSSYRLSNEIISNPIGFMGLYLKNWMWFRQEWLAGAIGRFGYSYSNLSDGFFVVHGLVLIIVGTLDSGTKFKVPKSVKYGIFTLGLLTFLAVTVGFFINSPVGSNVIFGFQGRYFVAAVPFLLFVLFNDKIEVEFWEKWQTLILGFYAVFMLSFAVSEMEALFYAF